MMEYRVTYEIDVDGEDPLDAAEEALRIIMDPDNLSRYTFDVWDEEGVGHRVSLDTLGCQHEVTPL